MGWLIMLIWVVLCWFLFFVKYIFFSLLRQIGWNWVVSELRVHGDLRDTVNWWCAPCNWRKKAVWKCRFWGISWRKSKMKSIGCWFNKLKSRDKAKSSKKEATNNGKEGSKAVTSEEAPSNVTKQKVAAAKQYIENHYKEQMKNLQERKERYGFHSSSINVLGRICCFFPHIYFGQKMWYSIFDFYFFKISFCSIICKCALFPLLPLHSCTIHL